MFALIALCAFIFVLFILPLLLLILNLRRSSTDKGQLMVFISLAILAIELAVVLIGPFEKLFTRVMCSLGFSIYINDNYILCVVLVFALEFISYKIYKLIVKKAAVKYEENAPQDQSRGED